MLGLDAMMTKLLDQVLGRLMRRAAAVAVAALFVLIALYHANAAGVLALQLHYGELQARLIAAGVSLLLGLIAGGVWWALRAKPDAQPAGLVGAPVMQPRAAQIAMLVEAAMLGYTMARKTDR